MKTKQSETPAPVVLDDLYTVDGLVALYPTILSVHTLRHQLRTRQTNGLASACIRAGKKLLISRSRYERWVASRAEA